ncbi:hypothetical protein ACOSQ2_013070 [Xanthoceras sorbifolium]
MITVLIKYERLPDFCYGCGFIGHSFRECHKSKVRKSIMDGVEPKFGLWLRASPLDRSKYRQRGEDKSEAKPNAQKDIEDVDEVGTEVKVEHLGFMFSDHRPIAAKFVRGVISNSGNREQKFRFEPLWLKDENVIL